MSNIETHSLKTDPSMAKLDEKSPNLDAYDIHEVGSVSSVIEIDPIKERAAMKKFDMFVLPVSVIFMILAALDRNNVSQTLVNGNLVDIVQARQC